MQYNTDKHLGEGPLKHRQVKFGRDQKQTFWAFCPFIDNFFEDGRFLADVCHFFKKYYLLLGRLRIVDVLPENSFLITLIECKTFGERGVIIPLDALTIKGHCSMPPSPTVWCRPPLSRKKTLILMMSQNSFFQRLINKKQSSPIVRWSVKK